MITGLKDVDREVLKHVDDRELLTVCSANKKLWNEICDDNFLRRRLSKYPNIEKYKRENESWKRFYLRFVYYTAKMRDEFQFEYRDGDFKKQYRLLREQKNINLLFIQASKEGELSLVVYAIEKGADVQSDGDYALRGTASAGHLDVVKYLVEHGADIHGQDELALRWASSGGHLEVVKYLVEHGADIHVRDDLPLGWASQTGHLPVVKYLVEHGANIHAHNNYALIIASQYGHLPVVKYLAEKTGVQGIQQALTGARLNKQLDVVKYLENL